MGDSKGRRRSFWTFASEGIAAAIASLRAPDRCGDAAENEEEAEVVVMMMKLWMTPLAAVLASSSSFDHPSLAWPWRLWLLPAVCKHI